MSARTLTDGQIVIRSLRARPLSTWITVGMVAISVALLLVLLGMRSAARGAFDRGSGNIHLLVSADPSPLVAVLNGIFYANAPSNPITWAKYQAIRGAFPYQWTIPTQQGDSYRSFPTMATSTDFFGKFEPVPGEPWKLTSGRFFERPFEIVLGAAAAKGSSLRLGQEVFLTHGSGASREGGEADEHAGHVHAEYPFKVVGILEPTGSAHDRALFIDLESSWILHAQDRRERAGIEGLTTAADLEDDDRKVTGILLRLPTRAGSDASAAMQQQFDTLRRDTAIVVAQPAQQIQKLFEIVSNVDGIFIGMAVVVLISSALSTMLALYNSMAARTRQIAVLRVLGASQGRVFGLVLTESLVITMAGAVAGIALALVGGIAASAWLKASIGLVIDPALDPRSTVIVLGGAVALGGLAGILPAWRAYQVPVADNLRPAA
jgi:putative ABC transport system permease protein